MLIIKGANLGTKYAARLAEGFHLSKYTVGFIIVAVISILPETFVAISSAIEKIPSFGLGTLFGSNIADLTLVFAIILYLAGRGLKVEGKILKNRKIYPLILLLPLILGLDGFYSRIDGMTLIIVGVVFYYIAIKDGIKNDTRIKGEHHLKNFLMLLLGMALLLVGSHFVVTSASSLAFKIGIDPILIGMFVVGIGTTIPELFFAIKSIKRNDDSLAIGDILGTVLADATIVVGILALVSPFNFSLTIIFVTGFFMVIASLLLYYLMFTGRTLARKEAYLLFLFWLLFVFIEFIVSKFFRS